MFYKTFIFFVFYLLAIFQKSQKFSLFFLVKWQFCRHWTPENLENCWPKFLLFKKPWQKSQKRCITLLGFPKFKENWKKFENFWIFWKIRWNLWVVTLFLLIVIKNKLFLIKRNTYKQQLNNNLVLNNYLRFYLFEHFIWKENN